MSTTTSPFFTLPRELRDHIYNLTFTNPYATTLSLSPTPTTTILHPLTRVSRLLRQETLQLSLNLTRFNAHLDDGPATPLANWLRALGPEKCLWLREVGIWDLHMLNGRLVGERASARMLRGEIEVDDDGGGRGTLVLRPVGRDIFHGSWYLKDIVLTLRDLGLGLRRFCEVLEDGEGRRRQQQQEVKQMSHFAIVPAEGVDNDDECGLAGQFGLTERERESVNRQLGEGERRIVIHDGRRNITLVYSEHGKLIAMRQQFIPRDEEFYI